MLISTQSPGKEIKVKISHYNPKLGGPNCFSFVDGECISSLSNGEKWETYFETNDTIACPIELDFGTRIMLNDTIYTCRDRGGEILMAGEAYWIDILAENVPYAYGEVRTAYIVD